MIPPWGATAWALISKPRASGDDPRMDAAEMARLA